MDFSKLNQNEKMAALGSAVLVVAGLIARRRTAPSHDLAGVLAALGMLLRRPAPQFAPAVEPAGLEGQPDGRPRRGRRRGWACPPHLWVHLRAFGLCRHPVPGGDRSPACDGLGRLAGFQAEGGKFQLGTGTSAVAAQPQRPTQRLPLPRPQQHHPRRPRRPRPPRRLIRSPPRRNSTRTTIGRGERLSPRHSAEQLGRPAPQARPPAPRRACRHRLSRPTTTSAASPSSTASTASPRRRAARRPLAGGDVAHERPDVAVRGRQLLGRLGQLVLEVGDRQRDQVVARRRAPAAAAPSSVPTTSA